MNAARLMLKKLQLCVSDTIRPRHCRSPDEHLAAAAEWLLKAQRATPDDGISHSYNLLTGTWAASYPETTGYAIETLYAYGKYCGRPEFLDAARRAADWEIEVQLPDGGVRAGTMDASPVVPTVFNTGQVLFGWVAAAEHEASPGPYLEALRRAGDWLVNAMDDDGGWRRFKSPFGSSTESSFNTRTAFGLARAAQILKNDDYLEAAVRHVAYVAAQARPNGFLPNNCLTDNTRPLTHTLAYSIRGLLEVGAIAGRDDFLELATQMAIRIAATQRKDGAIPGRMDEQWRPAARWVCVTGVSQMALNWLRLQALGAADQLAGKARRANRFVMRLQYLDGEDAQVKGGIKGSEPLWAEYMPYRCSNWTAKFLIDSLLEETEL